MVILPRILRDPNPDDSSSGGSGGGSSAWFDSMPDPIKTLPDIKNYKTVDDFAKGYTQKIDYVNRKGVILPKENDENDWGRFTKEIGRPEKWEDYKFDKIEGLHPNISVPELDTELGKMLHGEGLPSRMAKGVRGKVLGFLSDVEKHLENQRVEQGKATEAALRKEWGEKYDENTHRVLSELKKRGGDDLINSMGGEKAIFQGSNPKLLVLLNTLLKPYSEGYVPPGGGGDGAGVGNETPEEAQRKIEAMRSDLKHPLNIQDHREHNNAVEELTRLYKRAYPA